MNREESMRETTMHECYISTIIKSMSPTEASKTRLDIGQEDLTNTYTE